MDYVAEVRRRAASAIRYAAREHLTPLGLRQMGSSPRLWRADHGWWLINVEFQASSGAVATYLNVGLQYPWRGEASGTFMYGYRRGVRRSARASLGAFESDAQVDNVTDAFARRAAEIVAAYQETLTPDDRHLEALVDYVDRGQTSWNRALALVLLGRHRAAAALVDQIRLQREEDLEWYLRPVLGKSGRPLKRSKTFEAGKASRAAAVARSQELQHILTADPELARPWITEQIRATREKLKLPPDSFGLPPPPKRLALFRRHGRNLLEDLAKL